MERLIGEGAVRTVKKPSQIKKRLITTQPSIFYRKEYFEQDNEQGDNKIFTNVDTSVSSSEKNILQEGDSEIVNNYKSCQDDSVKSNSTSGDRIRITADEQSDVTYFMMNNNSGKFQCRFFICKLFLL